METKKLLGLSGAALLVLGAFMPIVSLPIIGSLNYLNNGQGDGIFVILLAIVAVALTLSGNYKFVWIPGAISAALILFTLIRLMQVVSEARANLESELAGNPFAGLAEGLLNTVQLQWGWVVLALGSILVIATSLAVQKQPDEAAEEASD